MGIIQQEDVIVKERDEARPIGVQLDELIGTIETVDTVPTSSPTTFSNQFKIYKNGATKRLYWYDTNNDEWSYVTGT